MKSKVLERLLNTNSFEEVNDKNTARYLQEKDAIDNLIDIEEVFKIIRESGKLNIFIDSMDSINEDILFDSALHGISHNERVAIFVFAIGILEGLNDTDLKLLLEAAKYHDIGRINNGKDVMHGIRSAQMIEKMEMDLSSADKEILKAICIYHSDDDSRINEIANEQNITPNQMDRFIKLANILKDADALDRVRLKWDILDTKYLRTEFAKRMVPAAYEIYYNYGKTQEEILDKENETIELKKDFNREIFSPQSQPLMEDEDYYYYFRATTTNDIDDLNNPEIARLRTNREREEAKNKSAKYSNREHISLDEIWDHIRWRHSKETNCISLSANSNVIVDYAKENKGGYAIIKVPKKADGDIYYAGPYMLEQLNNEINKAIEKLPQNSEVLRILRRIEVADNSNKVHRIVSDIYNGITRKDKRYTGKLNKMASKSSIFSRFTKKQYFTEEQQLEYDKLIGKLTILEAEKIMPSIITSRADNSSLIATIGMAFSSGEVVHYKGIKNEDVIQISQETMDFITIIQQLKYKYPENESIRILEKELLNAINNGYKISRSKWRL